MSAPLCVVVKGFPRVSETFVTRELEALQDAGIAYSLAALRRPGSDAAKVRHRVSATPNYLPEYLHEEPIRVAHGFAQARKLAGFGRAWRQFRADFARDLSRNRIRRFGQACVLASELAQDVRHLHAHFIHTPTSVARYAAIMRGLSFSVSAHARDIWTAADWDLREKLDQARFVCTCNEAGAERLAAVNPAKRPQLWPHLIHPMPQGALRANATPSRFRLLTVARAVPKKGLEVLLSALARLPADPPWTWTHIGGGELLGDLRRLAQTHPYKDRIEFQGTQSHEAVQAALRNHDVFVLSATVSEDGDRDGRPNALIEAMSAGLACVATPVGGIPELLRDGAGLLAQTGPDELARTLAGLFERPEKIVTLGRAAQRRAAQLSDEGVAAFRDLEAALREASGQ
jgi:colanic acid/amylovoran biosynthesis glycosyltransferase